MIPSKKACSDAIAGRLNLYQNWPEMDGCSEAKRPAFNNLMTKNAWCSSASSHGI